LDEQSLGTGLLVEFLLGDAASMIKFIIKLDRAGVSNKRFSPLPYVFCRFPGKMFYALSVIIKHHPRGHDDIPSIVCNVGIFSVEPSVIR